MISKKMVKALNEQINKEIYSAYLYKAMGLNAKAKSLNGTAAWMEVQDGEEMGHAKKFQEYLLDQGEAVVLEAIDKPKSEFGGLKDMFIEVLAHEKKVTASILSLVELAQKDGDVATGIFLQWFVTEQIEEEKNASEILQKVDLIGGSGGVMYMLDKELGKRGK